MSENDQALLILEKLDHFRTIINARLDRIEDELHHQRELNSISNQALITDIVDIKKLLDDHETRIRINTDSSAQFRLFAGGASLTSIFAIIRSFLP